MPSRIITTTFNCGHCDYCKILKEGVYNDALCKLHEKRVSSFFPFCDDWTEQGREVSHTLPYVMLSKNLPVFAMSELKG